MILKIIFRYMQLLIIGMGVVIDYLSFGILPFVLFVICLFILDSFVHNYQRIINICSVI